MDTDKLKHLDLDVLFTPAGDGYSAIVTRSPAGDGQSVTFGPLLSDVELENFVLKVARFKSGSRRVTQAPVAAAKELGARLFDAIFTGEINECLTRSTDRAREEQCALRIRMRVAECPALVNLPWELLYDRDDDSFLALSDRTPVIRYLHLANPARAVPVTLPLRILVIRSEPNDYPSLGLATEWEQVRQALEQLSEAGLAKFTELAVATLSELRRALLADTFHVLHYMGHGGFATETGGVLVFTDSTGRGVPVTSSDLGVLLRDHASLRLAVLNACEGARTDPVDPFAGVATTLVRRGIPAVVAMQFEISDSAAIEFAPALYGALVAGRPIDAAVVEARKAIYTVSKLEWATPVLYLRADDAVLFDITSKAQPLESLYGNARAAEEAGDWDLAEREYARVVALDSTYRDAAARRDTCSRQARVATLQGKLRRLVEASDWRPAVDAANELADADRDAASQVADLIDRARAELEREREAEAEADEHQRVAGDTTQSAAPQSPGSPSGDRVGTVTNTERLHRRLWVIIPAAAFVVVAALAGYYVSTSSQVGPFYKPTPNFAATPGLGVGSAMGHGRVNTNTNPGFDTFHIGSDDLTVNELALDIYAKNVATPIQAVEQLQHYNPQLGGTLKSGDNVLYNNFITVPTRSGQAVAPSQRVASP